MQDSSTYQPELPTSTGLPLFDAARAAQARDQALDAVEQNATPDVRIAIAAAIRRTADEVAVFTTDHVWARVPAEHRQAIDPRVMGALMVAAAREGHIVRMPGVFLASDMVTCHRRPKQAWTRARGAEHG